MTAVKPKYVCDVCKYDGGIHYTEDPVTLQVVASRCHNRALAEQAKDTQRLAKLAHEQAYAAAKEIVQDYAETRPFFNSNDTRPAMEDAGVPSSLIGQAFLAAERAGLIEPEGRDVMSSDPGTRHRVHRWRSLVYGQRRAS